MEHNSSEEEHTEELANPMTELPDNDMDVMNAEDPTEMDLSVSNEIEREITLTPMSEDILETTMDEQTGNMIKLNNGTKVRRNPSRAAKTQQMA